MIPVITAGPPPLWGAATIVLPIEQGSLFEWEVRILAPTYEVTGARMQFRERLQGPVLFELTMDENGGISKEMVETPAGDDAVLKIVIKPSQSAAWEWTAAYVQLEIERDNDAERTVRIAAGYAAVSREVVR
jgi:hypothetical protein